VNLTRLALSNPVAVIAAILLVFLLGTIGLVSLPIQMIPDVTSVHPDQYRLACRGA